MLNLSFQLFLGVAPFGMTYARSQVVTYVPYLDHTSFSLFIQTPTHSYNFMSYIETLRISSWVMVLIFALLFPFAIHLTMR